MAWVGIWTGREVHALRQARRMSVCEFADHLGVSDRMVSKWEAAGQHLRPRPLNQAALDTSLAMATTEAQDRFAFILGIPGTATPAATMTLPEGVQTLVRHPIDGKVMTLVDGGPVRTDAGLTWLTPFFIDVWPVTHEEYARFAAITGHLPAPVRFDVPDSDPVTDISWSDALGYARWASKRLPDAQEWDQAATGGQGMTCANVPEWCQVLGQPIKRGRGRSPYGFRCAAPAGAVLALLAI